MPGAFFLAALLSTGLNAQQASSETALSSAIAVSSSTAPSSTVRLVLIEPALHHFSTTIDLSLERALKEKGPAATLLDTDMFPCEHSGKDYRFPFPAEPGQAVALAARLDSTGETAFVVPPIPSLVDKLLTASRDPETYRSPWSVSFSSSRVMLSITRDASGRTSASTSFDPGLPWSPALAAAYRLDWEGAEVRVFLAAKPYGGLGRMATALESESKAGPLIGVARGGVFGDIGLKTRGADLALVLERLGLKATAVGCAEISRFEAVQAYRSRAPGGIAFLSANLVYSSAPHQPTFDDHTVVEAGGLKVLVTAVTPPGCAKFLRSAGLGHLSVTDPLAAVASKVAAWRRGADAVVLLVDLTGETRQLETQARGVDLVLAENRGSPDFSLEPAQVQVEQARRRSFDTPLLTMRSYKASLGLLEFEVERKASNASGEAGPEMPARWKAVERHLRLDDRFPEAVALQYPGKATGFASFDPEAYGLALSTEPALIPSAAEIYPRTRDTVWPRITAQGFWSLAASLLAEETRSEAALLRAQPLTVEVEGAVKEGVVRLWLGADEAVVVRLRGGRLKPLLAEAERQRRRAASGLPAGGAGRLAAGGVGPGGTVNGLPVADDEIYRVAVSRVLLDSLGLAPEGEPQTVGQVQDVVIAALKARAGAPPSVVRGWMAGRPVKPRGLWRIDFRDIGLNIQSTRVVRDDAFGSVPNSRIQGYDELLIGGALKTDAEYLRSVYKWRNTLEMVYARSAVTRRNQEKVVNITANSIRLLTLGTRRAGGIAAEWLARSWGPSLGFQFDGQVEAVPGLRRREVYSVFPGVEFYDGSWVRSLEFSGSFRRDLSRDPPDFQYGLRTRLTMGHDLGKTAGRPITLQGEAHANYYFLTGHDRPQDLRMEGGVIAKLRIPLYKHLSLAPFIDFYWFGLKVRPLWGYSAVTGVSIGFSRLWKPQYESF
ncbi:MAG: hypothetical protein HY748_08110 [Elusimicrobia bacterium]|nr:hypothetical protein [Elusimicrobiota bacterium]